MEQDNTDYRKNTVDLWESLDGTGLPSDVKRDMIHDNIGRNYHSPSKEEIDKYIDECIESDKKKALNLRIANAMRNIGT